MLLTIELKLPFLAGLIDLKSQINVTFGLLLNADGFVHVCSVAMGFYILLRAVDHIAARFNCFPGELDG